MMFFEYLVWGAWYVTLGTYMGKTLRFSGTEIGLVYGTTALAAMISPFFVGMVADRFFATEKLLAALHLFGALLLALLSTIGSFPLFYTVLLIYTLCYMPTLALTNSLSFHHMKDPGSEFPRVRVFGTIAWIVIGLILGKLKVEDSAFQLWLAAGGSAVMGLYALTLPHTPPKGAGQKVTWRQMLGLEALELLRDRSFSIFIIGSFAICIPLSFYFAFANLFFNEIGIEQAAGKMTMGQVMEILVTLAMPFFLARLGIKKMMLTAMAAWTIRYLLFAAGNGQDSIWMLYFGILLQGICFAFVFVAGQIFVDRQARPEIRAAAQGLITFVTFGAGMLVGSWLSGWVAQVYTRGELANLTHHWPAIWMVPALISAGVFLLFALFFKPSRETDYASPQ